MFENITHILQAPQSVSMMPIGFGVGIVIYIIAIVIYKAIEYKNTYI